MLVQKSVQAALGNALSPRGLLKLEDLPLATAL